MAGTGNPLSGLSPFGYMIGGLGRLAGGGMEMIGGVSNLAAETIRTAGNIADAASKDKEPDKTINQENLGIIAIAAGQQVAPSGGGTLPPMQNIQKPQVKAEMPTQKLLGIAVKYLESIDSTLKKHISNQVEANREQESARKEAEVEGDDRQNKITKWIAEKKKAAGEKVKGAASSGMAGALKIGAMVAAAAALGKLATMNVDETKKLIDNITEFEKKYSWLIDVAAIVAAAKGGAWLGSFLALAFKSARSMLVRGGAIGGIMIAAGYLMENKREEFRARNTALFSAGAQERAEKYFQRRSMLMNSRGGDPTKTGTLESIRSFMQGRTGTPEEVEFLKNDLRTQGYTEEQIDQILFAPGGADEELIKSKAPNLVGANEADATKVSEEDLVPQTAYDIVYGNGMFGDPQRLFGKKLTDMTIGEVTQFQDVLASNTRGNYEKNDGKVHTPVGAYQFVKDTLIDLAKKEFGDNWANVKFDAATQDKLAKNLWNQSRGGDMSQTWAYTFGSAPGQFANTEFESVKSAIISKEVGSYVGMKPAAQVGRTGMIAGGVEATIQGIKSMVGMFANATAGNVDVKNYSDIENLNRTSDAAAKITEQAKSDAADAVAGVTKAEDKLATAMATSPQQRMASAFNAGTIDTINPNFPYDKYPIVSKVVMQGVWM